MVIMAGGEGKRLFPAHKGLSKADVAGLGECRCSKLS